ncbi:hypothetical protein [Pontibacter arcticus]|uniref:Uncharacterized protein n=1 Tax=Pontibacter arcticus TaxID=2080288 RepID=A0A364RDY1_9BACT|nr:hypothetical protein [Pontibacter arcticus]RAU82489.1 hypothetical protein DP923_11960 [Pontibacter arcticus]
MSKFETTQGGQIDLSLAAEWTANYRRENAANEGLVGDTKAHFFGRDIIQQILDQENCAGITMCHALDETGAKKLILVGTTEDGVSMEDGIIADFARPCPPSCASGALLNGLD